VLLFARIADGNLEIVVSDNGPGMDTDDLKAIMEGQARHRDGDSGILKGLGLALARQLVESHGGSFQMDSVPGEGTTVVMRLPEI
jgi:signal transduction histidine kinase